MSVSREHFRLRSTRYELSLQVMSRLARALHGGRVTMCKSGKDRTSMSLTLEHAGLLQREHGFCQEAASTALQARPEPCLLQPPMKVVCTVGREC